MSDPIQLVSVKGQKIMTRFTTTLGAPISEEEYRSIEKAILDAKQFVGAFPMDERPEVILGFARLIIDHGFKISDTVNNVFGAANKRAFPGQARVPLGGARKGSHLRIATAITELGEMTDEGLEEALKGVKGEEK